MLLANRGLYLALQPVDIRKSIDALSLLVSGHFEKNLGNGAFYVFSNLKRDKLKVLLYWDTNGCCLCEGLLWAIF
jgi:transposase